MIEKLQLVWKHLESLGYKPHYLAIYWSQNYWLDINDDEYQSDIDYKCIIIPTLNDLVRNSKPLSIVIDYDGGQIDIKDIRSYVESVVKCNVNFLEILQTEHYICAEWTFLREYLEPLMSEMWQFYLKACYGMMLEKNEALRHPYPSTRTKIEKFGYDTKQLHHIMRLLTLIIRYVDWDFPNFIHTGMDRLQLISIKKWDRLNNEIDDGVQLMLNKAKEIRDNYTMLPCFDIKNAIIEKSYSIIYKNICQNLKK